MAGAETSIKQAIQEMAKVGAPELLEGTVISESPLQIQIANDSKLIISEAITVVPRHLTEYKTTLDIKFSGDTALDSTTTVNSLHSHKLENFNIFNAELAVHNELKRGEKVHVLAINHGKKFYVMDRVKE